MPPRHELEQVIVKETHEGKLEMYAGGLLVATHALERRTGNTIVLPGHAVPNPKGGAKKKAKPYLNIREREICFLWGKLFPDDIIAAAILDRLLHHSTTINIKGESYRLKEERKAGVLPLGDDKHELIQKQGGKFYVSIDRILTSSGKNGHKRLEHKRSAASQATFSA